MSINVRPETIYFCDGRRGENKGKLTILNSKNINGKISMECDLVFSASDDDAFSNFGELPELSLNDLFNDKDIHNDYFECICKYHINLTFSESNIEILDLNNNSCNILSNNVECQKSLEFLGISVVSKVDLDDYNRSNDLKTILDNPDWKNFYENIVKPAIISEIAPTYLDLWISDEYCYEYLFDTCYDPCIFHFIECE